MIDLGVWLAVFGASLYAGLIDLKKGEIPNHVTMPLIGIGVLYAILNQNPIAILTTTIILYAGINKKLGKIGAGDTKLVTGIILFLNPTQILVYLWSMIPPLILLQLKNKKSFRMGPLLCLAMIPTLFI